MNTDSLNYLTLEDKISSFEATIGTQQSKIDSLSMVVHDIGIEKGFFSSMLSIQTGIFSLIVMLILAGIGLLSWNFIKREVNKLENKTNQKIDDIESRMDEAIRHIEYVQYHLCVNLSYSSYKGNFFANAFIWAIRASVSSYNADKLENINLQIEIAKNYCPKVQKRDLNDERIDEINRHFQTLSKIEGVDQEKLSSIKHTLNSIYYSPDQEPPAEAAD